MKDPRIDKLAENLINYSTELKKGENILIEVVGTDGLPLATQLIEKAYEAGGVPFITIKDQEINRHLISKADKKQLKMNASWELSRMKKMDAYIGIRAGSNISEMSGVPSEKMSLYMENFMSPVHSGQRVKHTKWCVMRYPNHSMAQLSSMPTEAFEELYFKVCNLDYSKMSTAMDNLASLMEKTDKVMIKGKGTNLEFSIKGLGAVKCDGKRNIPDGEVYSCPIRSSVNGKLTYNTPAVYQGVTFENISFEFKNGKIISATANNEQRLNSILDTDDGARYIGEFSLGVNPYILEPMKDTLFDEKIMGSFHFTPGRAYDECDNGNRSAIHWDLVCIQRPEYGGGEIWFDDRLIRKDGTFVIPELECLNPENLI